MLPLVNVTSLWCKCCSAASVATVSEIAAAHWPFSYKFQHMVDQKSTLVGHNYSIFSMGGQ